MRAQRDAAAQANADAGNRARSDRVAAAVKPFKEKLMSRNILVAAGVATLLAACATAPQRSDRLEQART